jgi:hypothetical protein
LPEKDQTRAIIHPMNVQPVKIFTSKMPNILLCRLTAAIIVGKKYRAKPIIPNGKPQKGKVKWKDQSEGV